MGTFAVLSGTIGNAASTGKRIVYHAPGGTPFHSMDVDFDQPSASAALAEARRLRAALSAERTKNFAVKVSVDRDELTDR